MIPFSFSLGSVRTTFFFFLSRYSVLGKYLFNSVVLREGSLRRFFAGVRSLFMSDFK